MIREFLAKHISYRLQDYFNGTSVLSTHRFLNGSQSWEREALVEYQWDKFQKLLHHSVNHVPYYRELFRQSGLEAADIREPADLYRIPVLTKEIVRKNYRKMQAEGLNPRSTLTVVTGGTTGPPLKVLRDRQDSSFTWGAFYPSILDYRSAAKTSTWNPVTG